MTLTVTFDSNIFQPVLRPDKFPNDPEISDIQAINDALRKGKIFGFIAETMADLEAIRRDDRAAYFSSCSPSTNVTETELSDGTVKLSFSVGPDLNAHPGIHQILVDRFSDALSIGIKFLRCPRISLPRPELLQDSWFVEEPDNKTKEARQDRFFSALREIEARDVGRSIAEQLGLSLNQTHSVNASWFEGLAHAQSKPEIKKVAEAVAEWADGDAVAAHIGYQNALFCTRDEGIGAGTSILDQANRKWLNSQFGVEFVTAPELASRL